jgi:manganese/zinc/iron transport system ATP- binding protein
MEKLIQFENVDLGYGQRRVLRNIDFDIATGDFLGIVGPNGAGKTTLLKAILGLLNPLSGRVTRPPEGVRIGYVPQRDSVDSLFPLTVLDIVLMGRYTLMGPFARPGIEDRRLAMRALEHVGMDSMATRAYPNLSGGQKQRALIARALVGDPGLLILDEPTNGMDLVSEHAIMELVKRLHDEDGITVLMVSHLLSTVVNYAKRVAIVGDGTLKEGTVDEMVTPQSLTDLYGMDVNVVRMDGQLVVLPPRGHVESDDKLEPGGMAVERTSAQ